MGLDKIFLDTALNGVIRMLYVSRDESDKVPDVLCLYPSSENFKTAKDLGLKTLLYGPQWPLQQQ